MAAICLAAGLAPAGPAGDLAAPPPPREPIRNRAGDILEQTRILKFDGAEFSVEHLGGIARVPYGIMPEFYRRKYFFDPERAEEAEIARREMVELAQRKALLEVQRGILERRMRYEMENGRAKSSVPSAPPSGVAGASASTRFTSRELNDPTLPMRFEVAVRQNEAANLQDLGGPPFQLQLLIIGDTHVLFRTSTANMRATKVAIAHGMESSGQNLAPIFQNSGCTVYWVDTLRRPADGGILLVEYAVGSPLRPGSRSSAGGQ